MPPDKVKSIALGILKFLGFLVCFYFFICALELLTTSFKLLIGTDYIKRWITWARTFSYPTLMMVGVVGTMMLQSSSAFTSVLVAVIAADAAKDKDEHEGLLKIAIPMIMGANFGTTITNTLASMAHLRNRNELRLAIAASSIHDFFNWGTMLLFIGLEVFLLTFLLISIYLLLFCFFSGSPLGLTVVENTECCKRWWKQWLKFNLVPPKRKRSSSSGI